MKKLILLFVSTMIIVFTSSCSKDDPAQAAPDAPKTTATAKVANVGSSATSITVVGEVLSTGNATITDVGFYIGTETDVTNNVATSKCSALVANVVYAAGTTFTFTKPSLISNTTYFIKAYVTNTVGTISTTAVTKLTETSLPSLTPLTVNTVQKHNASFNLTVTRSDSGTSISDIKFILSKTLNSFVLGQEDFTVLATPSDSQGFAAGNPLQSTVTGTFTAGSPGDQMYARLAYKVNGTQQYSEVLGYTHAGFKQGNYYTYGGVAFKCIRSTNDGSDADLLDPEERKDPRYPGTLGRPAWDYQSASAGTSTNIDSSIQNTTNVLSVLPSQVYQGYINPYGANSLARNSTRGGLTNWSLMSKDLFQYLADNRTTLFTNSEFSSFFKSSIYWLSSEISSSSVYAGSFYSSGPHFTSYFKGAYTDGDQSPAALAVTRVHYSGL